LTRLEKVKRELKNGYPNNQVSQEIKDIRLTCPAGENEKTIGRENLIWCFIL